MRLTVMLVVAALTTVVAAQAQRASLIEQGLAAYTQGQQLRQRDARLAAFAQAESLFNQAARLGPSANAELYANAGTAALQAESLGAAVLAFRRALAIDPDHARARRNLAHARGLLPAWVPRVSEESVVDTFFFWHKSLSRQQRLGLAAWCFALAALAAAAAIRWPGRARLVRGLGLTIGLAWAGLLTSALLESERALQHQGVIIVGEVVARASDSINAPGRFAQPLPAGAEVEILRQRQRWIQIRLANGREAWVPRPSLQTVDPAGIDGPA